MQHLVSKLFIIVFFFGCLSCANNNQQGSSDNNSGNCKSGYTEKSNKFFNYCVNNSKNSDILFLSLNGYTCKNDNGGSLITSSNESSYKNSTITKVCNDGVCPANPNIVTDIDEITSSTTSTSIYLTTTAGKTVHCTMEE